MLGEEEKDASALSSSGGDSRKTYSRSVSWTGPGRSPTKSISRPQWNSKARACLPPLSVSRPKAEEWPRAGSDDLGVWPSAPCTPGVRVGPPQLPGNLDLEKPQREFEFKKDKLAFYDKLCSRIADHIYLGSDAVAKDREILRQNGITHVLNCVGFVCPEYFKNDLVYKTLWLRDSPTEDITSILYDVFDYFEDVREQNGRILVHCCQGVSRSTSLVIAYLMWREGQSFEGAFQYVKAARGVTNPNMGFACQLLQCQKRVHAAPASPNSVLRMYRMAPHSSYDPLHLVPKSLSQPKEEGLDSRGAFIVHVPSAIYVWIGKNCISVMEDSARTAASQVIRYESAKGPALIIREGEEPYEFWNALGKEQPMLNSRDCQRKVDDYDLDFEIFHKVVSGGVVPPSAVPGNGSETCLPVTENGWGKLRQKFVSGVIKGFITSSVLTCDSSQACHRPDVHCKDVEYPVSPTNPSLPSSPRCDSPDSFSSFSASPNWLNSTCKEVEHHAFGSPDSFSCFLVNDPNFHSSSPSLSPSTSDYSNSFTFSPSSSNWSDLSYLSAQPSPTGMEHTDPYPAKNASVEESACLVCKGPSSPEDVFSANDAPKAPYTCLPCRESSPSIAERRGSNPPPRMMLAVVEDACQVPKNLGRSWSFSLPDFEDHIMRDDVEEEDFYDTEDPMLVADSELQSGRKDEDYYDACQCQH